MAIPEAAVAGFRARHYETYGGTETLAQSSRTGFSGEVGESELPWYLLGERLYVPALRQFLGPDAASPFDAGGLNRYAYCGGDPVNRIDPSGESFLDFLGAALGILGAAIGVAVTGGALLGLIGAAGGLAAAMSSTAGATMAAATVLEVTSVVAEVGTMASLAARDQKAAGIFGWVSLGAGVASAGLGGLGKIAAKSARHSAHGETLLSPVRPISSSVGHDGGFEISTSGKPGNERSVILHFGYNLLPADVRHAPIPHEGGMRLRPQWTPIHSPTGQGLHWTAQVRVSINDVIAAAKRIAALDDGKPLTLVIGGHGRYDGGNWFARQRLLTEASIADWSQYIIGEVRAAYPRTGNIRVVDLHTTTLDEFKQLAAEPGHILYGFCYSMADEKLMKMLRLTTVSTYILF